MVNFFAIVIAVTTLTADQGMVSSDPSDQYAFNFIRSKALYGDAQSQYNLGLCYASGGEVAKDPAEAVKWFKKSAEQGYPEAQFKLGIMYETGWGIPKNDAEAAEWFRKASEQGFNGIQKSDEETAGSYRKAAERNYTESQYRLGSMYFEGRVA